MGREVRKVPASWVHPRDERGRYIPLHDGDALAQATAAWDAGNAAWSLGYVEDYSANQAWKLKDGTEDSTTYAEYSGERPDPKDYMPSWPEQLCTYLMMYEDTSEGTPISPAFATPEEMARWLADNGASAFGDMTATYEQWLATCKRGFAPSMVMTVNKDHTATIESGVADLASP